MSNSKNNQSIFNLLFLFAISLTQVSAGAGVLGTAMFDVAHKQACPDLSNQCCTVVIAWKVLGGHTTVDPNERNACCRKLGDKYQFPGIPGVHCNTFGQVTELEWGKKYLSGYIPSFMRYLADLEKLNLNNNHLKGVVPLRLESFTKLRDVKLAGNIDLKGTWQVKYCDSKVSSRNTKLIIDRSQCTPRLSAIGAKIGATIKASVASAFSSRYGKAGSEYEE